MDTPNSLTDTPDRDPSPPKAAGAHEISGWRKAIVSALTGIFRLWGRTLRLTISPEELRNLEKRDEPVAFVLWHNRLFITAEILRRYRGRRPLYALISASRDGAWLEEFLAAAGMRTIRGSSSRLGREAANALVAALREGHDVGITPDGPRGPAYEMKAGALIVTRRTGTPILLLGAEYSAAWRFQSWDRFYLPLPFSRVRLRCLLVPARELADRDEAARALGARLREISPDQPRRTMV